MTELEYKDTIAFFLSFCIEIYKRAHDISGEKASRILSDSGAINYLQANYEPIHTQAPQWILEGIEDFMLNRKDLTYVPLPRRS